MQSNITIRRAVHKDADLICRLYYDRVRNVNFKDYSPEQIEVWSNGGLNPDKWKRKIDEQYFILAEIVNTPLPQSSLPSQEGNIILGFSSIAPDGYLDFLYAHKDYQRHGVASALLKEIETKAAKQKNSEIYSHVNKTAKGFFEKMGDEHKEDLRDMYKGVMFINALMVKKLSV